MRRVHAALRAFAPDIVSGCKADRRALCGDALDMAKAEKGQNIEKETRFKESDGDPDCGGNNSTYVNSDLRGSLCWVCGYSWRSVIRRSSNIVAQGTK